LGAVKNLGQGAVEAIGFGCSRRYHYRVAHG